MQLHKLRSLRRSFLHFQNRTCYTTLHRMFTRCHLNNISSFFHIFQAPQGLHWTMLIMDLLKKINHWDLCFCSQNLLAKQAFNLKTNGGRSFAVAASTLWNSLPNHTKNCIAVNNNRSNASFKELKFFFPKLMIKKKKLKNYLTDSWSLA